MKNLLHLSAHSSSVTAKHDRSKIDIRAHMKMLDCVV
uniref:Uncharacterized protein n=1 Tax=Anguilla anguilla TaxID=7936 RepID=A0A0E9PAA0_ANGAN